MTESRAGSARDLITMAAIAIVTMLTIIGVVQGLSWLLFRESTTTTLPCLVLNDFSTGVRAIPGSACHQKSAEGQMVDYRFNRCGHRTPLDCTSKPPGTRRIVLIGSSFGYGMHVDMFDSFAERLPRILSQRTKEKIDLYNESMQWGFPSSAMLRLDDVFSAQPDVILWPITPTDINSTEVITPPGLNLEKAALPPQTAWQRLRHSWQVNGPDGVYRNLLRRVEDGLNDTRFIFLLKHLLYQSQGEYIRQYLARSDNDIDYLKSNDSAYFQGNLQRFSECLALLQRRAKAAGATVVITAIPDRAQAAMISRGTWPHDADPYKLDKALHALAAAQGVIYLDLPRRMQGIRDPDEHYLAVDGHPDALGHAMIAELLAQSLLDAQVLGRSTEPTK